MGQNVQRPKGTQDITPRDADAWQWLQSTCIRTIEAANYSAMHTPIFEDTALFQRGIGESTDVVNKEMYTFEKGKRSLTLRPEGTASVARAFVENGFAREPMPQRYYYMGPMFRYERPQEGRQRQFHQVGAELLGLNNAAADAESILLAWEVLKQLGLNHIRLEINTVGDPEDRPAFRTSARTASVALNKTLFVCLIVRSRPAKPFLIALTWMPFWRGMHGLMAQRVPLPIYKIF
jgi:histidyl-tRNA synthetase